MSREAKYRWGNLLLAVLIGEGVFWALFFTGYFIFTRTVPGFRFEHPHLLWILAVLPLCAILYLWTMRWKNKALRKFGEYRVLNTIIPNLSSTRSGLKFLLLHFGLAFLIIGLANPQFGTQEKEGKTEGIDLMICLDLSQSMLAEDIPPSRLERAKRAIEKLIGELQGDRIGIIVFGGEAYVQLPITMDHSAAQLFLSNIDPAIIPVQGTAIGASIDLALSSFDFENGSQKAIIVISDGENHRDDPISAAQRATEKGVTIHTIGMGSPDGAPIPKYRNGQQIGYKKDREGKTVISKLDETTLVNTAEAGSGIYTRATSARVGLQAVLEELRQLEKKTYKTKVYTDYADRFQLFLAIGVLLLLTEAFIPEKKSPWKKRLDLFGEDRKAA